MAMTLVAVVLEGWEHLCCGERRRVGDVVTIAVQNSKGTIFEERHGALRALPPRPIAGIITAIR